MRNLFQLKEYHTTFSSEALCGVTTFLAMSYVLSVNPAIVSQTGMPFVEIFVATALASGICCLIMGFFANIPFAMAPGMGLNTFFTYVVCVNMGFHWKEGLALLFITGLLHICIMTTGIKKVLVNALPDHLKIAFGIGLGLFICYIGLKSGGFLQFTIPAGQYMLQPDGSLIANSSSIPSLTNNLGANQLIALVGLLVMLILLTLEKKTGDRYGALPVGILTSTFIGIPLLVTNISDMQLIDFTSIGQIKNIFGAFWGDPGLLSVFKSPEKILLAALAILILLTTNIVDSIGTIIGIGQTQGAETLTRRDLRKFKRRGHSSKLDKALISNSFGGCIGAICGTTICTTYMESITGIVAGGRTGLTAVVAGCLFFICLPFAGFFSIIPPAAIAPALIIAGAFMLPLASRIHWSKFEEAFPAVITIMGIPLTYGFVHGIAGGVLAHVVIQITSGGWRKVHPALYCIACIFILVIIAENWV